MANDIPAGLRIPTQIPLDAKAFIIDEDALKNLGVNDNLAFTYFKRLRVICQTEGTEYEWKEMEEGDTGLLTSDFTYPPAWIVDGIDYSDKIYNFVLVQSGITPELQGLQSVLNTGNTATQGTSTYEFSSNTFDLYTVANLGGGQEERQNINSYGGRLLLSGYYQPSNPSNYISSSITLDRGVYQLSQGFTGDFTKVTKVKFQEGLTNDVTLLYPKKSSDGEYIIATLDDIVASDQNNFVRYLNINTSDLPTNYSKQSVIDEILSYPEVDRTIADTDSKWNINIGYQIEDGFIVTRTYELQNTGKGIITDIEEDNLQVIFNLSGIDEVIGYNPIIEGPSIIKLATTSEFGIETESTGQLTGFFNIANRGAVTNIILSSFGKSDGVSYSGINIFDNKMVVVDEFLSKGLEYGTDYEANFTNRSLVTKQYVDQKKQKILEISDFTAGNYILNNSDDEYLIFVNNGATNVTITVPSGLKTSFFVAILQEGTGDILFVESGTDINPSVGLKIKGQNNVVALDKKISTETFYLTGNNKI